MKTNKHFFALLAAFCALIAACDLEFEPGTGTYQNISWDLRGKWVTNSIYDTYYGTLEFTSNRITITGYIESDTYKFGDGDDTKRPFRVFLRDIPIKAYTEKEQSEDGKTITQLFIEDFGIVQDGIPYTYWYEYDSNFKRIEFLRFNFGGRNETLRKVEEY